jgi:hypothetical protein
MALLGLLAIAIPPVWIVISSSGSLAVLAAMSWPVSAWATVLVSAIAPVLMIWFLFRERSAPANSKPNSPSSTAKT